MVGMKAARIAPKMAVKSSRNRIPAPARRKRLSDT